MALVAPTPDSSDAQHELVTTSYVAASTPARESPHQLVQIDDVDNVTWLARRATIDSPDTMDVLSPTTKKPSDLGHPAATYSLSWSDLSYSVATGSADSKAAKKILQNVSGRCGVGELTAVMGPSGCGKTTLLDILADRVSSGAITGRIELNGEHRDARVFRRVARYVAQEDALLGCFTVRETLQMAAQLTMVATADEMQRRVDYVLQEVGLRSCEHTYVGDVFHKGISGGQKRRLSIAIELLSNPSVLLLDEPTSGLDSASTFKLLQLLQHLGRQGRTIVCTIHQPSSLVFEMFHNVVLLVAGRTAFCGPRADMIPHFAALGHACPAYSNPSEFFVGLVNADFEGHGDVDALVAGYADSALARRVQQAIEDDRGAASSGHRSPLATTTNTVTSTTESPTSDAARSATTLPASRPARVSARQQFHVLLVRNLIKNVRNPGIYGVRLAMYVILATMVGTMYLRTNKRISDQDIVVLLFGVHAFFIFNAVAVVPFFVQERAVFLRERGNSALNVGSYVVANFLAAVPGAFAIALVASIIVVFLTGIKAFGYYLLNMFLSMVAAESLMHLIGGVVKDGILGIALGASLFGMFMLCEGFMVPRDAIPGYWIWAHYLAFHSYAFEGFIQKQFLEGVSDLTTLPLAVQRLGFADVSFARNMAILAGYAVLLEVLFAAVLYKFHTGRR
ncbi:hypothetical protein ATCC90586_000778 [Pythium insidiosum]|nr:hypothetical protein ATCC90586_000778 [Pythium insidiosum]